MLLQVVGFMSFLAAVCFSLEMPLEPDGELDDAPLQYYYDDNVIDLLEALNITRSIKGINKAKGMDPGMPAWKFRSRVPHLTLLRDYSIYLLSTMQSSVGFHFIAKQSKNTIGTLISFVSPAAMKKDGHPLLQLVSNTKTNQLILDYRKASSMEPASMVLPGMNPFAMGKWARLALNVEPQKITMFVDCEEAVIYEKNNDGEEISFILPIDLEITFASTSGDKDSKFLGFCQTAEISPSGLYRRPWHCENITDLFPVMPYSLPEERSVDQELEHSFIQDTSKNLEPLLDIQNYQQQQSEPQILQQEPRINPQTSEERIQRLEDLLSGFSTMLDMVKAQNADLLARVKYLETCECRRPTCSWEGRVFEEGSSWDKDGCNTCVCSKGEVRCSLRGDRPQCVGCMHEGQIYSNGESFRIDACTTCVCLSGNVSCNKKSCPEVNCQNPVLRSGECCADCPAGCNNGRENGESWRPEPCANCTCEDGKVQCFNDPCQPVTCQYPIIPRGKCCPECSGCVYNAQRLRNGQSYQLDHCTKCICRNGNMHCQRGHCPELACLEQHIPQGACCPICRPGCEYDGQLYDNGESFLPTSSPCMNCSCLNSLVRCAPLQCPSVSCSNPIQRPGQCCPTCPVCEFDGKSFEDGQIFTTDDGCRRCTCLNGQLSCTDVQQCSQTCSHGIKHPSNSCCQDCTSCDYQGQIIPNGMSFVASGDVCHHCQCSNGNVLCNWITCPNLSCVAQVEVPGECCKQCQGCIDTGIRREHLERWQSNEDPCNICRCLEGEVICEKERCNTPCQNPANPLPGSCCPRCDDCLYNGQEYHTGDRVSDGSTCTECVCVRGNVQCSPVSCPPALCKNPVLKPGDCCQRCLDCEYDSQTFADETVFLAPRNPCLSCRCSAGKVSCDHLDHNCPPVQCSHPSKQRGSCCPTCDMCEYERRQYHSGQTFTPQGSKPCLRCTCTKGNVRCQEEVCQTPQCANPIVDPQLCCPICKVCVLEGVEYEDGAVWEHDEDPCTACNCVNGEPVCQASSCPPTFCLHPSKSTGECCPVCTNCYYNRRMYKNGLEFIEPDDPCLNCRCKDGSVQCVPVTCPVVTCTNPEKKPGQCCPKCPDCHFENLVFLDGERIPNPLNPCQECSCFNGHVTCQDAACPHPVCNYPLSSTCCQNNCNGCSYTGKEYPNGANFPHPTDKCRECHCINGNVQCLTRRCPPLPCADSFLVSGECCPQCPAPPLECFYSGHSFKHMERFYDPLDKCRICICNNGTVTCQRKPCAPVMCSHPILQDCCRTCDGCLYQGRELPNGEQFADPVEPCNVCFCREGSVSCEKRPCPVLECPYPVMGQCCKACEGCEYLGEEYLNGQEFQSPDDHCSRCSCLNGFVTCSKKPCYNPGCSHPISLPDRCCPVCEGCFFNGVAVNNGQTFPDPSDLICTLCTCRSGSVQCLKKLCSPAPCSHPVQGPCDCPLCEGCHYQGRDYIDGQAFPSPKGTCQECRCQRGEVSCGSKTCNKVTCSHPAMDLCTCPVCDGCFYNDRECSNGERFPDPKNKCSRCTCLNGEVTCVPLICPSVSCHNPLIPSGECCPVCSGRCNYQGQIYESGTTFESPSDSCSKCTCLNEVVTCQKKPCSQQCSHPLPSPAPLCCPICDHCFFEGMEFENRQTYFSPSDPCQRCTCLNGNVICTPVVCPQVTCTNPITRPGQCCQECPVCTYFGKEYAEGSHWISAASNCHECVCVQGEVTCSELHCDVSCRNPVPVAGQCCPICWDCMFEGLIYNNGDTFNPDPCRQCTCQAGNVHCDSISCPQLKCMHQVTEAGACCPRCRGCIYSGFEYKDGSSWFAPSTPCMSCMCVDGVTTCSDVHCVSSCVNTIQVPGECCPLCADCVYNNQVYGPGESFQPADDPCEICTCEVMSDGKQHLRCYRKQCPSLVDCPKSQIHFVGSDHCCPTCAQPLSNCTTSLVGSEVYATDDACYTCHCKDLTWVCLHQQCPMLSCPTVEQFTPHGSCCPICDECVIEVENRRVSDGETWIDSIDNCVTCMCNLGHIECHIQECVPVVCQDGLVKVQSPETCCYECQDPNISCTYQGEVYQSNGHWEVDECTSCTCVSGEVHCQTERCPQVSCASDETPALIPGMCCPHCIPRPATCIAFGDPHYRTFDGKMIHFQGACTYVMAEDCEGGDFSIHVTNDDRGRKGVSWTKEVTVLISDIVIQLLQDWIVMVDHQTVDLPYLKEPYIYIERKTNTILLNTNIGVKVLWNGKSHLEVSVPGTYKRHMCGLCGNFNNYPQDDLRIRTGQIVISEAAFGNSWKVQGANYTSGHCSDGEDVNPCKEAGYRARREANAKCKILKSKVFERCHNVVPPEMFFASCVYDLCACGANVDDCLCDALEAYASECREAGIILQWRSPTLCAVGCPHDRGYVFDECGPPCPKTCFNKDVPLGVIEAHCFKPCTPGCQCPAGLLEHESHCILPEACPRIIYGHL